jgi:hypothetical protein
MPRNVGFWVDSLILADSIGLIGFEGQDSLIVVDKIPWYDATKHKQHEKREVIE